MESDVNHHGLERPANHGRTRQGPKEAYPLVETHQARNVEQILEGRASRLLFVVEARVRPLYVGSIYFWGGSTTCHVS